MKKLLLAVTLATCAWSATRVSAQAPEPQIPQRQASVTVTGEVAKPGIYQLSPNETLVQVLARAGGLNEAAANEKIYALREGVKISIGPNAEAMSRFQLSADDLIVVPTLKRVAVAGFVTTPKTVELPQTGSLSVREAIALAGGIDVDTEQFLVKISVLRPLPDGVYQARTYVLPRDAEALEASAPLRDGDVVYVQRIRPKSPPMNGNLQLLEN